MARGPRHHVMTIINRPNKKHKNADILSQDVAQPWGSLSLTVRLENLPCCGCHHCRRTHGRWQDLSSEVQEVIPVASLFSEENTLTIASVPDSVIFPNMSFERVRKGVDNKEDECGCELGRRPV